MNVTTTTTRTGSRSPGLAWPGMGVKGVAAFAVVERTQTKTVEMTKARKMQVSGHGN